MEVRTALFCGLFLGPALALAGPLPASTTADRFALVIGYNGSDSKDVAELRYADDDAIRNAALLRELGVTTTLLTLPDPETARIHGTAGIERPTPRAVETAVSRLQTAIAASKRAGRHPVFYFVYSGHGDVRRGEGFVHLDGGLLKRGELLSLIRSLGAEVNHVIVDACKSYFLVFSRGPGGNRRPVGSTFVPLPDELPPSTGVFLSTSSARDSHEWEAYQAGVFSHELRSALRGAADVDLDGHVSYREAAAFISTANSAIRNLRFRPAFYSRPPAHRGGDDAPLVVLPGNAAPLLTATSGPGRHVYLEDGAGTRIADFHLASGQPLRLMLPERRPLFLRDAAGDREVVLSSPGSADLGALAWRKAVTASRGAEHEAFARLFAKPFDLERCRTYAPETLTLETTSAPRDQMVWLRRGLGIAAAAAAATGAVLTGMAYKETQAVDDETPGTERASSNDRLVSLNRGAAASFIAGAALLGSYLTWTLWPEKEELITITAGLDAHLRLEVEF